MSMDPKLKAGLLLMKQYCQTFNLKPTANKDDLEQWESVCGPMIAGAFLENDMPPIVWTDASGNIWINQDEDLLDEKEPATAIIGPDLLMVAINNKRAIHPTKI